MKNYTRLAKQLIIFTTVIFIISSCGDDGIYNEETNREAQRKKAAG